MTSQHKVFDSIEKAAEHLNTGLISDSLSTAERIQLIKEWREQSWTWLYLTPDLVYSVSVEAVPASNAFAKEIKANRNVMNSDDRKDYFHQLTQFYNDELKRLQQAVGESIEANNSTIEKLALQEPDQYVAGRPKLINSFTPQKIRPAIEEGNYFLEEGQIQPIGMPLDRQILSYVPDDTYTKELNKWRESPVGKWTELNYEKWKTTVQPFNEYRTWLLRLQSDVSVIAKTIHKAVPGLEEMVSAVEEEGHNDVINSLAPANQPPPSNSGQHPGFNAYIKEEHRVKLIPILTQHFTDKKQKVIVPMLYALEKLSYLESKINESDQVDLHKALTETLGNIGKYKGFNTALNIYDPKDQKTTTSHAQKIETYRTLIEKAMKK